jgi:hypothetical protein
VTRADVDLSEWPRGFAPTGFCGDCKQPVLPSYVGGICESCRLDRLHEEAIAKQGRRPATDCRECGKSLAGLRGDAFYCGETCRQRAHRRARRST